MAQSLPHQYVISAEADLKGNLVVSGDNLPNLEAAPPIGFDGPGDVWSPEDLLMAAVASCTILSFRAIARASKLDWVSLDCRTEGILDRVERKNKFTRITTKATLTIANQNDAEKAEKLLHKAEEICLVSNSLNAESIIECRIIVN